MPSVLDFLELRQFGFQKSKKYVEGKKAVLDMLEYEASKPTTNQSCEFSGEPRATFLVDFSPNMLRAASTHGDHSVRVTDIATGKCTHVLTGHPRTPWCLAFNPTSNDILASGCLGGEVRIWDLLGGGSEVLHNPSLGAVITSLAFHPSGQVLVFATINCIYFWDWNKPTPFAVTKTNHEYERIRWLRFDPFGTYLYTGIANNTTLHREGARNVVNIRNTNSEEEGSMVDARSARNVLMRNRMRYNQLMQRFRTFQQSQNQRADYPQSVRPRSPVHEENLNMARQYANHVTERERVGASGSSSRDGPRNRFQETPSRPGIVREDQAASSTDRPQRGGSLLQPPNSGSHSTSGTHANERETSSNGRGWGRYQPSFFTTPTSAASDSNNNNSSSGGVTSTNGNNRQLPGPTTGVSSGIRQPMPAPLLSDPIVVPAQGNRPGYLRFNFQRREVPASNPSSVDNVDPSNPPWPQGLEPYDRVDELEPDEFEIVPVDQIDTIVGGPSNEAREFEGLSAAETARRLEQQLRQLRRELFFLTQNNIDINSAIQTLPNHGTNRTSPRAELENSFLHRSAFRSAGSALSRSIFSRSGSNSSSTTGSSSSTTTASSSSNIIIFSRSIPSISNDSYRTSIPSLGRPRSSNLPTSGSGPDNREIAGENRNSAQSFNERHSFSIVPSALTDNTSQTFGAMNLPEQLDRSTDITGLNQCPRNVLMNSQDSHASNPLISNDIADQSSNNRSTSTFGSNAAANEMVELNNNEQGNSVPLLQQTILSNCPMHTGPVAVSSSCTTSTHHSVPSIGILRSALTASSSHSSSLHLPQFSVLSSSTSQNSNRAVVTSSNAPVLAHSQSASPSTSTDSEVFRSIANLRNRLSDIMTENSTRSRTNPVLRDVAPTNILSRALSSDSSSLALTRENVTNPSDASTAGNGNSDTSATSERGGVNLALRSSIANVQRRLSDVLNNIRSTHGQPGGSTDAAGEEVQRLRDMEYRFLSQTSQVLSQTTAYWTEFLERSVLEMNQRITDLERRLETNRYLLSSNPFTRRRPGRPQDALMSSLFRNRNRSSDRDEARRLPSRDNDPPSSAASGPSRDSRSDRQIQRNQLLLDFLVWRGSRDSQSQRSLSFGQTTQEETRPSSSSSANSESISLPPPVLSSSAGATLSSSSSSAGAALSSSSSSSSLSSLSSLSSSPSSSSSVPLSVTIHPSQEERNEREEDMIQERAEYERRGGGGQIRSGSNTERDGSWLGLQHIHLHPDYSSSILDDTINRPNEAIQQIMNRTIAGVLDREEQAVASNIIPQTHRIQRWTITGVIVPDISRATANIVVEQCKLHNDASCDISKDGTTLATFVPSHRGFPDDNILGVFSLRKESFAQCLYTKSFGPNAISVSISPGNHYVMVGLAARRYFLFSLSNKMVGQVYKLVNRKAGEKSMKHITDLFHPRARGVQIHISVNFGRWLPCIGEGIVYGTNRGDLHFCRPGPRRLLELDASESRSHQSSNSRRGAVRSSIATQTTTVSIRRTASTQTLGGEDADGAGPSRQ